MDTDSLIALALLLLGLTGAGFGAAAAAALPAAGRGRRLQNGEQGPLSWVLRQRPALGFTTLAVSAASVAITWAAVAWLLYPGMMPPWPAVLAAAALATLLAWLAQAVPSALVARAPERAIRALVWPLRALHLALIPLTALYAVVARSTGRRRRIEEDEELESVVEELGQETADLEQHEREMIRGIMDLEHTTARMIMAPRMDIIAAEADAQPSEVIDLVTTHGYSRIPIYEETIDNIVGIVYAKDLLRATGAATQPSLRSLAREPYFVPESKKVDELLREFRQQRTHVAVVVDEYGGTAGLVTLEDLLEEIVGEIEDEYDQRREEPIVRLSETEAVLDARVSIEDLNDLFETEIEHTGYDTVGGLVYAHLGKIPTAGDEILVNGLTIFVESTLGRRIKRVRAIHTGAETGTPDH